MSDAGGKYSAYYSEIYPTDAEIERLLEKYGPEVEKYRPGGSLEWRIMNAKDIAANGLEWWKYKWASQRLAVLQKAYDSDSSVSNFARLAKFKVSQVFSSGPPSQKRDPEFFGRSVGEFRRGHGPTVYHGSDSPDPAKNEFKGSGMLGSPILVVKHGQDLQAGGAYEDAFVQEGGGWKAIECWNVGDESLGALSVVKGLGSGAGTLSAWLDANGERYLCSFWLPYGSGGGTIDPMTGQPAQWSDPESYTIGVDAEGWKGFLAPEKDYEVIDTGFTVFKMGVQGLLKVVGAGVAAIAPPPEAVELLKSAAELSEAAEQLGITEKAAESFKKLFSDESGIVEVTFAATAGGASLDCGKTAFKSDAKKRYGYGVKIATVKNQILELAKAAV